MRHPLLLNVLIAGSALLCNSVAAFHPTLHCGGSLVDEGDSTSKLVNFCGPPTSIDKREAQFGTEPVYETNTHHDNYGNQWVDRTQTGTRTIILAEAYEIWYYNFGPGNFVAYVHISGGRTIGKIVQGGYGN